MRSAVSLCVSASSASLASPSSEVKTAIDPRFEGTFVSEAVFADVDHALHRATGEVHLAGEIFVVGHCRDLG